jgi:hypothetical protein
VSRRYSILSFTWWVFSSTARLQPAFSKKIQPWQDASTILLPATLSSAVKPYLHSNIHAKKYGGMPDDYADIDDFIDSSKAAVADVRHRAILHSSFGCFVVEKAFGRTRVNSAGKVYSPRDVAEDHILQDLGFIPSLDKYLMNMTIQPWMSGTVKSNVRKKKTINLED